jgi:hypothetical protein
MAQKKQLHQSVFQKRKYFLAVSHPTNIMEYKRFEKLLLYILRKRLLANNLTDG